MLKRIGVCMGASVRDIARECGVSASTVSRALSGRGYVGAETAELVAAAAARLGYRRRAVSTHGAWSDKKLMLIVGDLQNPYYLAIIRVMGELCGAQGYQTAIFHSDYDASLEERLVALAESDRYNGLILINAMETPGLVRRLRRGFCPAVLVNRYLRSMDMNTVCIDNVRGGYMAAQYLLGKGHRRIAFLSGFANSSACQDRLTGFRNAMTDAGLPVYDKGIRFGDLREASGEEFADYFKEKLSDYTAVFFANYLMALGFVRRAEKLGLRVPEDVSVVCFDDLHTVAVCPVPLTTVACPPEPLAAAAARLLLTALDEGGGKSCKMVFPPELTERSSVRDNAVPIASDV